MAKILLVSRDELRLQVLDFNLSLCGHDVFRSTTVAEAQSVSIHHYFDLLICDFKYLDDLTCLSIERTVVMSEWKDESAILEKMYSEMDDYILEPFDMQELRMLVRKQLQRKFKVKMPQTILPPDAITAR